MDIVCIDRGIFESNVYVVRSNEECVVIDAGAGAEEILSQVAKSGSKLKYIILTHGHGDHIASVNELRELTGALVVAHRAEEDLLKNPSYNCSDYICQRSVVVNPDILVDEGDSIVFGDTTLNFIHTPGHTRGSMCIVCGDNLFTGDTLFRGSVGRTDLPTGDEKSLTESMDKLKKLKDDYVVYPGHGVATTIGDEKKNNMWWMWDKGGF